MSDCSVHIRFWCNIESLERKKCIYQKYILGQNVWWNTNSLLCAYCDYSVYKLNDVSVLYLILSDNNVCIRYTEPSTIIDTPGKDE